jgi:hypothetical protein
MKEEFKRYLASSAVTFIAMFLLTAVPTLLDGEFNWTVPTVIGALSAAVRIGVKAAWELLVPMLLELVTWAKGLVKK